MIAFPDCTNEFKATRVLQHSILNQTAAQVVPGKINLKDNFIIRETDELSVNYSYPQRVAQTSLP